jgi:hypothetical protein
VIGQLARRLYSRIAGAAIEAAVTRILAPVFPERYRVIPRKEDGVPMLRQFLVWGSPSAGSGAYLQSFVAPEQAHDFHSHRWPYMRSFVLSGMFVEERYPGIYSGGAALVHEAPSTYMMDSGVIHRLHHADPRTWTLFLTRGPIGTWSYYRRPRPGDVLSAPATEAIPAERRVRPL